MPCPAAFRRLWRFGLERQVREPPRSSGEQLPERPGQDPGAGAQRRAPTTLVLTPTQRVYSQGENRFGFGVFTRSAKKQVPDAQIALYVAKAPPPGALPSPKANGAPAGKGPSRIASALSNPASGPYTAKVESLETEPAFRAKTTADDPDAGQVVYTTQLNLPRNGEWRIGALIKDGGKLNATLLPSAVVGEFNDIPRVGQRPPDITPRPRRRWAGT